MEGEGRVERERMQKDSFQSMTRDGQRPPTSRKVRTPPTPVLGLALRDLGGAGMTLCPDSTKRRAYSLQLVILPSRTITGMLVSMQKPCAAVTNTPHAGGC